MIEGQRTVAIYGLVSPITGKVRYVGKSQDPKSRLRHHLHIARSNKHQNIHVYNWLRKLHQQDLRPKLTIIEEVDENIWAEREQYWIAHYGLENLCNTRIGGTPSLLDAGRVKMIRMNHFVTERQFKLLRMYSEQTEMSMAEILRRFVDDGLKKVGFDVNGEKAEEKGEADLRLILKAPQMLEALEAIAKGAIVSPDQMPEKIAEQVLRVLRLAREDCMKSLDFISVQQKRAERAEEALEAIAALDLGACDPCKAIAHAAIAAVKEGDNEETELARAPGKQPRRWQEGRKTRQWCEQA